MLNRPLILGIEVGLVLNSRSEAGALSAAWSASFGNLSSHPVGPLPSAASATSCPSGFTSRTEAVATAISDLWQGYLAIPAQVDKDFR